MNTVFRLDSITMGTEFREFLRTRNNHIREEQYPDELDWDDMTDDQRDEAYRVYFGKDH